jgi:hypothetical protein
LEIGKREWVYLSEQADKAIMDIVKERDEIIAKLKGALTVYAVEQFWAVIRDPEMGLTTLAAHDRGKIANKVLDDIEKGEVME